MYTHFVNDSVTPPVWVPDFPSEPPKDLAVAAYLDKNAKYFGEYGWVPVNPGLANRADSENFNPIPISIGILRFSEKS